MSSANTGAVLCAGMRIAVAPRFHVAADWAARLEVNGGLESGDSGCFPRPDWRRVDEGDIATLVQEAPAAGAALPADTGGLFTLPQHVADLWWKAAEEVEAGSAAGGGYQRFVDESVAFLRFKQLPLPDSCSFDVRVSQAGQRSTRLDATGSRLCGLGFGSLAQAPHRSTIAWVNLGDEDTHLVYLNLPAKRMRELAAASGQRLDAATDEELLPRFAAAVPRYPLVRLRLAPGEGLWFPAAPIVHDGDTHGKLDLDVVLTLTA